MDKISTAEVLRLRATSAVSRDQSVRRFAQDDDSVGVLTKSILNKLALIGHGPGLEVWVIFRSPLTKKLIDEPLAQPNRRIVPSAQINLGEHIFVTQNSAVGVNIDHRAIDLKERNHLRNVRFHHQRMRLTGSLVDIRTLCGRPIML